MQTILKNLIKIPSITGDEAKIAEHIIAYLQSCGLQASLEGRNVVCMVEGVNRSKCLILSGHMDTVGPGEENSWDSPPYVATKKGDYIYGLGATDMKGGLAVLLSILNKYSDAKPPCDIMGAFVVDEEVSGSGSKSLVEWLKNSGKLTTYSRVECIIAEPTDASQISIGHRGNQFVQIVSNGKDGHASAPDRIGLTAIKQAGAIIDALEGLQEKWSHSYDFKSLGVPTIGVTGIDAGNIKSPNKVAGQCAIQLDIRTNPLMHTKVQQLLEEFISDGGFNAAVKMQDGCPSGWCSEDAALLRVFATRYPEISPTVFSGSTDMCFFTNAGIPTLIYGPGQRDMMHVSNESISIKKMHQAQEVILQVIDTYAGEEEQ